MQTKTDKASPGGRSQIMMLKPDALYGPYALVEGARASDFFRCLGLSLTHEGVNAPIPDDLLLSSSPFAAQQAWCQCMRRAIAEEGFTMPLWCAGESRRQLLEHAHCYRKDEKPVATRHVLKIAVAAFGCPVVAEHSVVISADDVLKIYTDQLQPSLEGREDLMHYLANQEVCFFLLKGDPACSALQRLKIYARYFLRYRFHDPLPASGIPATCRQRHQNLLHVPAYHEQTYLLALCSQGGRFYVADAPSF